MNQMQELPPYWFLGGLGSPPHETKEREKGNKKLIKNKLKIIKINPKEDKSKEAEKG